MAGMEPKDVLARLQADIRSCGMSLRALAKKAGLSDRTVRLVLENGANPRAGTMQQLHAALTRENECVRSVTDVQPIDGQSGEAV